MAVSGSKDRQPPPEGGREAIRKLKESLTQVVGKATKVSQKNEHLEKALASERHRREEAEARESKSTERLDTVLKELERVRTIAESTGRTVLQLSLQVARLAAQHATPPARPAAVDGVVGTVGPSSAPGAGLREESAAATPNPLDSRARAAARLRTAAAREPPLPSKRARAGGAEAARRQRGAAAVAASPIGAGGSLGPSGFGRTAVHRSGSSGAAPEGVSSTPSPSLAASHVGPAPAWLGSGRSGAPAGVPGRGELVEAEGSEAPFGAEARFLEADLFKAELEPSLGPAEVAELVEEASAWQSSSEAAASALAQALASGALPLEPLLAALESALLGCARSAMRPRRSVRGRAKDSSPGAGSDASPTPPFSACWATEDALLQRRPQRLAACALQVEALAAAAAAPGFGPAVAGALRARLACSTLLAGRGPTEAACLAHGAALLCRARGEALALRALCLDGLLASEGGRSERGLAVVAGAVEAWPQALGAGERRDALGDAFFAALRETCARVEAEAGEGGAQDKRAASTDADAAPTASQAASPGPAPSAAPLPPQTPLLAPLDAARGGGAEAARYLRRWGEGCWAWAGRTAGAGGEQEGWASLNQTFARWCREQSMLQEGREEELVTC